MAVYAGVSFFDTSPDDAQVKITNFEECAAAGNRVGESHPRQCWTEDGEHFVEILKEVGTVAFVIDGDTIELTTGERVRYIGVDTPEKGECYYTEATEFNRRLVRGKRVTLTRDVTDRDRYGRLLRYVSVSNGITSSDVSRTLIRQGYGLTIYIEPDVSRYRSYRADEAFAIQAKSGLWSACR